MDTSDFFLLAGRLTTKRYHKESLNHSLLKRLVGQFRSDQTLLKPFVVFIKNRSDERNSQVKFLTLLLFHHFFMHSAHFRFEICSSDFYSLIKKFLPPYPPPELFHKKLQTDILMMSIIWTDSFTKLYPQLELLSAEVSSRFSQKISLQEFRVSLKLDVRLQKIKSKYKHYLEELKNILQLLEEENDEDVVELLKSSLKEYLIPLENCSGEIEDLLMISRCQPNKKLILDVKEFDAEVERLKAKAVSFGFDSELFEDVEETLT